LTKRKQNLTKYFENNIMLITNKHVSTDPFRWKTDLERSL